MRRSCSGWAVGLILLAFAPLAAAADFPSFRAQTIDPEVGKICYAVVTTDVDGDGRPDVVAVANDAVVWYQNPTWQKRDIIRGGTEPDNVCLQPHDVDGDGRVDFALGSAWRPTDTKTGGNLAIVTRTGAPEGTWRVVPIGSEPTMHRVRWGHVLPGGTQLITAPLQGRDTRGPDWGVGAGARIMAWSIPARPYDEPWSSSLIADSLHAVHNIHIITDVQSFAPGYRGAEHMVRPPDGVLAASWEGVFLFHRRPNGSWSSDQLGAGDQASRPNRGTSEVRPARNTLGSVFLAAIEPWHGSKVVAYRKAPIDAGSRQPVMSRQVVDESLAWGHAVACADLDGDGEDEVIVGQRDPNPQAEPGRRGPGVIIFDPKPGSDPIAFDRRWVDEGGVAVEDLVAADMNGDGRPEIIAGGRATHNVRIYWNEGKPRP